MFFFFFYHCRAVHRNDITVPSCYETSTGLPLLKEGVSQAHSCTSHQNNSETNTAFNRMETETVRQLAEGLRQSLTEQQIQLSTSYLLVRRGGVWYSTCSKAPDRLTAGTRQAGKEEAGGGRGGGRRHTCELQSTNQKDARERETQYVM